MSQGNNKTPARYRSADYKQSGHGTYNCRWRKQERRERAVARQKELCDANAADHTAGLVKRIRQDEEEGSYIEVKVPMDWKMMLTKGDR